MHLVGGDIFNTLSHHKMFPLFYDLHLLPVPWREICSAYSKSALYNATVFERSKIAVAGVTVLETAALLNLYVFVLLVRLFITDNTCAKRSSETLNIEFKLALHAQFQVGQMK